MIQTGCDGSLSMASKAVGLIDSFSLNVNFNSEEKTAIGDSWASHILLLKDWSGSFSATLDNVEHAAAINAILTGTGTEIAGTFKCGNKVTLTGNILINSASINVQKGSKTSLSINFTGNGALTATGLGSET